VQDQVRVAAAVMQDGYQDPFRFTEIAPGGRIRYGVRRRRFMSQLDGIYFGIQHVLFLLIF